MRWLVCGNQPSDERLFKVWASDDKWLYRSLRISFTFPPQVWLPLWFQDDVCTCPYGVY